MWQRSFLTSLFVVLALAGTPSLCTHDAPQRFLLQNPHEFKGLRLTCCLDKTPCGRALARQRVKEANEKQMEAMIKQGCFVKAPKKNGQFYLVKKEGDKVYTTDVHAWKVICTNCQKETHETYNGQDTYTFECPQGHDICLACLRKKLHNLPDDAKKNSIDIHNDDPTFHEKPIQWEYGEPTPPSSVKHDSTPHLVPPMATPPHPPFPVKGNPTPSLAPTTATPHPHASSVEDEPTPSLAPAMAMSPYYLSYDRLDHRPTIIWVLVMCEGLAVAYCVKHSKKAPLHKRRRRLNVA